jgi:cystathionine beta-lyase
LTVPEATYLAWIDARAIDADNPLPAFEALGVGLSDGRDFGVPGYLRLNFGCRRALLKEALQRLAPLR